MSSADNLVFLSNIKLIYAHGRMHSRNESKLNLLLAIHNSHFAVESVLREKAKDQQFSEALRNIGFERIIKRLNEKLNIPNYDDLLNLNTIRNNIEHKNVYPNYDDAVYHIKVVEKFLKWAYKQYFEADYDTIKLEDMIYDEPMKQCMLDAKKSIEEGHLSQASKKMYEALGAFKFMWFRYLIDIRGEELQVGNTPLSNILADFAFKIILSGDQATLEQLTSISTGFLKDGKTVTGVQSVYPTPQFANKEDAVGRYENILDIILSYQDRVPISTWRRNMNNPS
jgi:hypothetical protein